MTDPSDHSEPSSPNSDADNAEDSADAARRAHDRVTINKEFESFDAFVHEYVTNISRTGAFVKSDSPLPIGTLVDLRFTVFMDDAETIEGIGEVVRLQDDPPGMGVVFRELSQYSKDLIARLLTRPSAPPLASADGSDE